MVSGPTNAGSLHAGHAVRRESGAFLETTTLISRPIDIVRKGDEAALLGLACISASPIFSCARRYPRDRPESRDCSRSPWLLCYGRIHRREFDRRGARLSPFFWPISM